jgi:hypothetical protein
MNLVKAFIRNCVLKFLFEATYAIICDAVSFKFQFANAKHMSNI